MTGKLWQTFRDSFQTWTGMLLPENMRPPALETLNRRAREEGLRPLTYLKRLANDTEARQALIDGLGLGTTWFMRDKEGLRALVDALEKTMPRDRSLWVWSAGCSSGEEPYTLAMAFADAGISAKILATDLNRMALQRAREGYYMATSLRRAEPSWRRRHFDEVEPGMFRVNKNIRRTITFELHNLLTGDYPPPGWLRFDAVVCRNVLIYFERDQALAIIEQLAKACRSNGYLLLGALERPLFWMSGVATEEDSAELVRVPSGRVPVRPVSSGKEDIEPAPAARNAATPTLVPSAGSGDSGMAQTRRFLERAEQAEKEGRDDDALLLINAAISSAPLYAPAHLARGLFLKRCGKVLQAIDALRAARFFDAHCWLAPYQLGQCLDTIGERAEAYEAYRHALAVLETSGHSGLYREAAGVDKLASTAAKVCRGRLDSTEL